MATKKNLDKSDNFMFTKNTVGKGTQSKAGKEAAKALKSQCSGGKKKGGK